MIKLKDLIKEVKENGEEFIHLPDTYVSLKALKKVLKLQGYKITKE